MKICILTSSFPTSLKDTKGVFVYDIANYLSERGMNMFVLAPHEHGIPKKENWGDIKIERFQYFFPARLQTLSSSSGIASNLAKPWSTFLIPFFVIAQFFALKKLVKKQKIDIIHSQWIIPQGFNGAIINKHFHVSHFLTIHKAALLLLEKLPFRNRVTKFILANTETIVTVSKYLKKHLDNIAGFDTKAFILPMGIDVNLFEPLKEPLKGKRVLKVKHGIKSQNVILYVGRLSIEKGIQYLVKAIPEIVKEMNDIKLLIIGKGTQLRKLQGLATTLGVEDYIDFIGVVEHRKLPQYFQMADVMVLPSTVEGLGLVLVEAIGCGCPVIATNVGGIPDIVIDKVTGLLIEPQNPSQIANAVIDVLQNKKIREKLVENASEYVRNKFTWQSISAEYEMIYKNRK